jgi:hypothetical protein
MANTREVPSAAGPQTVPVSGHPERRSADGVHGLETPPSPELRVAVDRHVRDHQRNSGRST